MASAPPIDPMLMAPPSYDETMNTGGMLYPPGNTMPPPVHDKGPPAPYPTQNYTQMYPPAQTVPAVQGTSVISVQTVYMQPTRFGDVPVQTVCPMCTQMVASRLEYNSGSMTWLACAGIFIFGCIYGCCLIPFCVDSLKDVRHVCPNCNNTMGVFKRL